MVEVATAEDDENVELNLVNSSELREWASKALNDEDYKLAAAASLELLRRDFDDFEAHQSLLIIFNQLGFKNELVEKTTDEFKNIFLNIRPPGIRKTSENNKEKRGNIEEEPRTNQESKRTKKKQLQTKKQFSGLLAEPAPKTKH